MEIDACNSRTSCTNLQAVALLAQWEELSANNASLIGSRGHALGSFVGWHEVTGGYNVEAPSVREMFSFGKRERFWWRPLSCGLSYSDLGWRGPKPSSRCQNE